MKFPSSVHVLYLICVITILPKSVKNVYVKNQFTGDWEYVSEGQYPMLTYISSPLL